MAASHSPCLRTCPPKAAYVHIPFCRRRCFYCDFPISVMGDSRRGETSRTVRQYVAWLQREIAATPPGPPLRTIFFGGGTPSLLDGSQLAMLLRSLRCRFGVEPGVEISVEMDPGTFTLEQLQHYRQLGVTRVSLGVQSFQNEQLQACGRTHRRAQIEQAIGWLQAVNLPSWSLDLISGLPGQTLASWQETLTEAIAHGSPHLSVYDLTLEPGTAFDRWYRPGQGPLPSDETTAAMYRLTQQLLVAAGYQHYEISNYAQPGHSCRHNRVYWQNRPYYGFGMGATSYVHGQRVSRPRTRRQYYGWVEQYEAQGGRHKEPLTSRQDQVLETLMLGLRLAEGVAIAPLIPLAGTSLVSILARCLRPYIDKGWVLIDGDKDDTITADSRIRLRDPEGFLMSNTILTALFAALTPAPQSCPQS
ncbi:radical SAM family heme chaperone HemW [Halomicronema hongdechloris]|nr:radical SAM family heme chaperone HemW [Halomicronema hongdechloris]